MTDDLDLYHAGRGFPLDHISPSFINKYETCPLAALYYRQGRRKDDTYDPRYAEVGKVVHSLIEREYNPTAEIYEPEADISDSEMSSRLHDSLKGYRFLRRHDARFDPREGTQHPEVNVTVRIQGVPMTGFIDLLSIRGHQVYIDDWKTGRYKAADEQQIRIYMMMVSRILDVPARDIIATLDYLREENQKRIQRQVAYTSTVALEHHIVHRVIEPIMDLQFIPIRGSHCSQCEYRGSCEAW